MHSPLDARSATVLTTIIEEYIASAMPVGSRTVAAHSALKLSPASMRNTMADLTDLGYLEQPHTSAGRIPTSKAFRLYIDRLLPLRPLPQAEKQKIFQNLVEEDLEISGMLRKAASLLAARCNQVSVMLAPERKAARWNSIGFTPVGRNKVLAVLMLEGGMLETSLVDTPTNYSSDELTRFGNYLNSHFRGVPLADARKAIGDELAQAEAHLEKVFSQALLLGVLAVQHVPCNRELFVEGTSAILDQAEFSDLSSAREMFAFLEERTRLLELLDSALDSARDSTQANGSLAKEGVRVSFWEKNTLPACSMISASYGQSEAFSGVVSIIGPNRMDYAAVLPTIGYISQALTSILQSRTLS